MGTSAFVCTTITVAIIIILFKRGKSKKHFMGGRNTTSLTTYDHHECRDLLSKHNASSGLSLALLVGAAISSTELRRVPVPIPVPQHSHRGCSNRDCSGFVGIPHGHRRERWVQRHPKAPSLHRASRHIPSLLLLQSLSN